jgi:hypothetical protein
MNALTMADAQAMITARAKTCRRASYTAESGRFFMKGINQARSSLGSGAMSSALSRDCFDPA